jgi:hypothetical protein
MLRKITRIMLRAAAALFVLLVLAGVFLYFAIQSPRFQTWLGNKAGAYLSEELHTTIRVDHVRLKLFSEAELKGVLVLDLHKDTLFSGDALLKVNRLDFGAQQLDLGSATLSNATSKVILYKGDTTFNYQFLADYFSGSKKDTSASPWKVKLPNIRLAEVAFVYRVEKRLGTAPGTIDYDDVGLSHLNGHLLNIQADSGVTSFEVHKLSAFEKSGFRLRELSTKARLTATDLYCKNLRLHAASSFVRGDLHFKHKDWADYDDFVNLVHMDVNFREGTAVTGTDIGYFAKELQGLTTRVALKGHGSGTVSDLKLEDFKIAFGKETLFMGDIAISGLPETESSFLHVNAKALSTSYRDLREIPSWPFSEGSKIEVPSELSRLGLITYRGKLDGFFSDLSTYGTFHTRLGKAITQLSVRSGKDGPISYSGRLQTFHFNAGQLLGVDELGTIDMNMQVRGRGLDIKTLDAELEGQVQGIEFNRYRYRDLQVNGTFSEKRFNGLLTSRDPNADFDFNGSIDFQNKMPEMDFISTINRINFHALHFTPSSDSGWFSSQILIDISGDRLDNLTGVINLDNSVYRTHTRTYKLTNFNILMDQAGVNKKINLRSEYLTAVMSGKFGLSNLPDAFKNFLYHYYPTFFAKPPRGAHNDQFNLSLKVRELNSVMELLVPGFRISAGSRIEADFDASRNLLNFQLSSGRISYRDFRAEELLVILNESSNNVIAEFSGSSLRVSDSLGFRNFNFAARSQDKDTRYTFEWDNLRKPVNKGALAGQLTFGNEAFYLNNEKVSVTVNDSTWNLVQAHRVEVGKDGTVDVSPMEIVNNQQSLRLSGRLSPVPEDSLVVEIRGLSLHQFNPFLQMWKLDLQGITDGHVALRKLNNNLAFNGDLNIRDLSLNGNVIGALSVKALYAADKKEVFLRGHTSLGLKDESGQPAKNITFQGSYHLDRAEESLDFDFAAKPANLKVLNPFLEDILTIRNAFVNGEGKIHGTPSNIKIDGQFRLFNSEVKVDYTNVSYHVTGLIEVMPDQIRFTDLLMREKGSRSAPQGTINGNIFHTNFGRMQIDYDINHRNMLVLNTTERENKTFYGKIYGTGRMGIYGFINNLHMQIWDTTARGSQFVMPLDGPSEIGESDFIHFVKKDTVRTPKRKPLTGFDLNMSIHATPDAQVQIILDKQHGDMLNAQGQGDLNLRINTLGKFEMFGDYVITDGDYLFTLENVINKKFEIDPGSSISWSGDPYRDAEIDVVTSYRQRTSIAPLLADTTGQYKGRVPVDCQLLISGKLYAPQIRFNIEFPSTDANAKARIASVLSDEAELNRQVFSFLLFRSFVTPQIFNPHGGGTAR